MISASKLRAQANRSVRGAVKTLGREAPSAALERAAWQQLELSSFSDDQKLELLRLIRADVRLLKQLG